MSVRNNKTLVNGSLFSIYSFIGKGISFLILIMLANYISPEEYGYLNLFTTVISFVTIFIALSTNGYVSISFFKKETDEFKKDFTSIYLMGIASFAFFSIVVLLGGEWISSALQLSTDLLIIAVAISFFTFSFLLQQDYLRIKERVKEYGAYNISNALLNLLLTFFFIISLHQGWMGRVNAQILCTVAFGMLSVWFFFHYKLFDIHFDKDRYKTILAWGLPMIPHQATGWLRQGLDRYIINYFYSVYNVGIFSFALNISNVIEMIGMAFNSSNSVSIFQILSNEQYNNQQKITMLNKQTRNIGFVYLIAALLVVICVTPFSYFVLPQYRESIPYIWIISICGFLKCVYFLYCNYLFYYSKTKQLMYITFGTSILHVILSLLLTKYSLYLTAFVYVIVQFLILFFVVKESNKLLEKNLIRVES